MTNQSTPIKSQKSVFVSSTEEFKKCPLCYRKVRIYLERSVNVLGKTVQRKVYGEHKLLEFHEGTEKPNCPKSHQQL